MAGFKNFLTKVASAAGAYVGGPIVGVLAGELASSVFEYVQGEDPRITEKGRLIAQLSFYSKKLNDYFQSKNFSIETCEDKNQLKIILTEFVWDEIKEGREIDPLQLDRATIEKSHVLIETFKELSEFAFVFLTQKEDSEDQRKEMAEFKKMGLTVLNEIKETLELNTDINLLVVAQRHRPDSVQDAINGLITHVKESHQRNKADISALKRACTNTTELLNDEIALEVYLEVADGLKLSTTGDHRRLGNFLSLVGIALLVSLLVVIATTGILSPAASILPISSSLSFLIGRQCLGDNNPIPQDMHDISEAFSSPALR